MSIADPRAVLTRPARPPDLIVRYGDGPEHVADVRLPTDGAGGALVVVVVHGGFWRAEFDRQHTGPQCAGLAAAGYAVAAIEYRRTGAGGGWPATFDDVAAAVDAVPQLVADAVPGVDAARTVLVGHSAGGHLALWAASRHRLPTASRWHRATPVPIAGVVSLAGVADLVTCATTHLGDDAAVALVGGTPAEQPARYAEADPIRLLPSDRRTVLVHGTDDDRVPVAQSRAYVETARAAGDDATLVVLRGVEHFAVIDPASTAWPAVLDAIAAVLPPPPRR